MQEMKWFSPRTRRSEDADRWDWVVLLAYTQLRLALPSRRTVAPPERHDDVSRRRGEVGGLIIEIELLHE
jgi:hypothetical protein